MGHDFVVHDKPQFLREQDARREEWTPFRRNVHQVTQTSLFLKWRLVLTSLFFVSIIVGIKLIIEYAIKNSGWIDFADISVVLTIGIFIIGFMLAGVLGDYKESEKIPAELACTLETLEESMIQAASTKPIDPIILRTGVLKVAQAIQKWLYKNCPHQAVFHEMNEYAQLIIMLEKQGAQPNHCVRLCTELNNLRKTVTRIGVISRTGFLPPAYAALEGICVMVLLLLILSKFKTATQEFVLVAFISLIYIYMLLLIKVGVGVCFVCVGVCVWLCFFCSFFLFGLASFFIHLNVGSFICLCVCVCMCVCFLFHTIHYHSSHHPQHTHTHY